MIRTACTLALVAVAIVIVVAVRTDGQTAMLFSFVGMPTLGLALVFYFVGRLREGAFRSHK